MQKLVKTDGIAALIKTLRRVLKAKLSNLRFESIARKN